jgi:hypothetical protein
MNTTTTPRHVRPLQYLSANQNINNKVLGHILLEAMQEYDSPKLATPDPAPDPRPWYKRAFERFVKRRRLIWHKWERFRSTKEGAEMVLALCVYGVGLSVVAIARLIMEGDGSW